MRHDTWHATPFIQFLCATSFLHAALKVVASFRTRLRHISCPLTHLMRLTRRSYHPSSVASSSFFFFFSVRLWMKFRQQDRIAF